MKPDRNFRWVSNDDDAFILFVHDNVRAFILIEWGKPRVYIKVTPGDNGFPMGPPFPDMPAALAALRDFFGNQRIPAP